MNASTLSRLLRACASRSGLSLLALCLVSSTGAETILVRSGSVWRYLDTGLAPGPTWRQPAFDDTAWPSGTAPLGYGDGDEQTVIAGTVMPKPVTTYFRHTFQSPGWRAFGFLTLRVASDDGAIVFLNGQEIFRRNLPAGSVNHPTPASAAVDGSAEKRFIQYGTVSYPLVEGSNTLAVELHQALGGEGDARFDLELLGNLPLGPPTVRFLSPESGSTVLDGFGLGLQAETSDEDGHVYVVEYYANGNRIGSASSEPWQFDWINIPVGRYRLTAQAIDNSGRRGVSASVFVQAGDPGDIVLTRGPYLQMGTPHRVTVRWRTDWFCGSQVRFGVSANQLTNLIEDLDPVVEHELILTGLKPDTRYYYSVATENAVLASGPGCTFVTAPTNTRPVRLWVIGDAGTADDFQRSVRDVFYDLPEASATDLWLMLGDNAYECGTDEEYQRAVFDMYPDLLRRVVLWPTLGNHETCYPGNPGEFPYFDMFTLPTAGEAGGVASGTEKFYSFDYSNLHFVCLDSSSSARTPGSPMLTWLEADLEATDKEWIIAFWHHPPYSFGTHDSDREIELVEMRQHVLPILERHGADLVLCGHSHVYERSHLLNGHYGLAASLTPAMILDGGFGQPAVDRAYRKPTGGAGAHRGTVYAVCGCSGQGGTFTFAHHPAMRVALSGLGSMILEIDGRRLDARFIRPTGAVEDSFTIIKGAPGSADRPRVEIFRAGSQMRLSWPTADPPFLLEAAGGIGNAWLPITATPIVHGRRNSLLLDSAGTQKTYRLRYALDD